MFALQFLPTNIGDLVVFICFWCAIAGCIAHWWNKPKYRKRTRRHTETDTEKEEEWY